MAIMPSFEANMADDDLSVDVEQLESDADEYKVLIGHCLMSQRKRLKLVQQDIADRLGKTRPWVSQIENGENDSHTAHKKYAMAMGVSFSLIVAQAESMLVEMRKHQSH